MDAQMLEAGQNIGRRERNKQKVKERLYTSALALFGEQGYDRTSIDQIAERADVARGTFFNYFQRKEDLIGVWAKQRRDRLKMSLMQPEAKPQLSSTAQLEQCMSILGEMNEEEPDLTVAMLTAWVKTGRPLIEQPYLAELFSEIVEVGREQGELAADLDPRRVGNILRDIYLGALYRWVGRADSDTDPERAESLSEELRTSLRLLAGGIATTRAG